MASTTPATYAPPTTAEIVRKYGPKSKPSGQSLTRTTALISLGETNPSRFLFLRGDAAVAALRSAHGDLPDSVVQFVKTNPTHDFTQGLLALANARDLFRIPLVATECCETIDQIILLAFPGQDLGLEGKAFRNDVIEATRAEAREALLERVRVARGE